MLSDVYIQEVGGVCHNVHTKTFQFHFCYLLGDLFTRTLKVIHSFSFCEM